MRNPNRLTLGKLSAWDVKRGPFQVELPETVGAVVLRVYGSLLKVTCGGRVIHWGAGFAEVSFEPDCNSVLEFEQGDHESCSFSLDVKHVDVTTWRDAPSLTDLRPKEFGTVSADVQRMIAASEANMLRRVRILLGGDLDL